jgi:hypothetical protein
LGSKFVPRGRYKKDAYAGLPLVNLIEPVPRVSPSTFAAVAFPSSMIFLSQAQQQIFPPVAPSVKLLLPLTVRFFPASSFFPRKICFFPRYFQGEIQRKIWGRCYDHNFLRVLPIFGEKKLAFSQKTMRWSIFSKKLAVV